MVRLARPIAFVPLQARARYPPVGIASGRSPQSVFIESAGRQIFLPAINFSGRSGQEQHCQRFCLHLAECLFAQHGLGDHACLADPRTDLFREECYAS